MTGSLTIGSQFLDSNRNTVTLKCSKHFVYFLFSLSWSKSKKKILSNRVALKKSVNRRSLFLQRKTKSLQSNEYLQFRVTCICLPTFTFPREQVICIFKLHSLKWLINMLLHVVTCNSQESFKKRTYVLKCQLLRPNHFSKKEGKTSV